jgi:hypothetical protein
MDPRDDSLMSRFDREGLRAFRARDAVLAVALAAVLLVLLEGGSVLKAGDEMKPGIGRSAVLSVGRPSADVARALPLASVARAATSWLNPEPNLSGPGGFRTLAAGGQIPPVTPEAFTAEALGEKPAPKLGSLRDLPTVAAHLASIFRAR